MKLTYRTPSFFPFAVPEKDATFAASVGPQTVYPAGFSLDRALQIYWRAQHYHLTATGGGGLGPITQALAIDGPLPSRNAAVGTNSYSEIDGVTPSSAGDFVVGRGVRVVNPGSGTVAVSGDGVSGTNSAALFNLQVNLFYPEFFAPDPVVKFDGKWWPAMSVSRAVTNVVELDGGGEVSIGFDCTTFDPGATTEIGTFSFFGVDVPVFCSGLAPSSGSDPAETRTFSGALTVDGEFA